MRYRLIVKTIFFPKLNNVEVAFYVPNMISITSIKVQDLFNQKIGRRGKQEFQLFPIG